MILMKDVTSYSVGDQDFPVDMTREEIHGRYRGQGYCYAFMCSQETGLPIVAHGINSTRNPKTKAWEVV